jgi:RHS repeat-associated protein
VEEHAIYIDPLVSTTQYYIVSSASPARNAGAPVSGFDADILGNWRHKTTPCMGAYEWLVETATRSNGCVTARTVAGRTVDYQFDGDGRLTSFTDQQNSSNNATYSYDPFGRRIAMTVGDTKTRFVYQGDDIVAEYVDEGNNGSVDKTRVYWTLPDIDQRVVFVDIEGGTNTFYYYLCDQVGSVMQVVRQDGTVVNQYDYDAYGNLREDTSFETVPNRYRFQGREWDEHAHHYYFRNRVYFPEWGTFASPDMNMALGPIGEPMGMGRDGPRRFGAGKTG